MRFRGSLMVALVLGAPAAGAAQGTPVPAAPPPATLPGTEVRTLYSAIVGDTFQISVALPPRYARSTDAYPVVYLTDANILFASAAQTLGLMQLGGDLPGLLLVGIGYPAGRGARDRDYTPTHVPELRECSGPRPCGGAAAFLDFLREELKPFIAEHYRSRPDDDTLVGVSRGGLFAFYALLEAPHAFERFLISSPELIWDDGVMFQQEEAYAAAHDDLPARVFMAVGGLEDEPDAPLAKERNLAQLTALTDRLRSRGYTDLVLESRIYPGETHFSLPILAISQGLRFLFGPAADRSP